MKSYFHPAKLLFYLLSLILSDLLGMFLAGVSGVAKGQGLAGGAIIFGYGVMAAGIGLLVSISIGRRLSVKQIVKSNIICGIILLLALSIAYYRYQKQNSPEKEIQSTPKKVTASFGGFFSKTLPKISIDNSSNMGLGIFKPHFFDKKVLYFYGSINIEKSIDEHSPTDSLVFEKTEYGYNIAQAPPWFMPEYMKMDYDVLFLKVMSVHSDFAEVMVNSINGQSRYIDRQAGEFQYWPDFLLHVNSIEPIDETQNLVRIKPLDHASPVNKKYAFLRPLRIADEWAYVELLLDNHQLVGKGWIKWRENGKLLISYSLFS